MPSTSRAAYKAEWYAKNKDRQSAQAAERYMRDRERLIAKAKAAYRQNAELKKQQAKLRYAAMTAEQKRVLIERSKCRDKLNPDYAMVRVWMRRKRNQLATPPWLSSEQKSQMRFIYRTALLVSKESGVKHHVDHIVPLRGRGVCGLNVPWNLQIITATENVKKGNRVWPDMPNQ
jgi:5-methylcytosine-specific restriction endonuclease McrA